ncbi:MAG: exodeoxyribonuclease VII large subunit, partial [Erysipelotrichaceae bacterium]
GKQVTFIQEQDLKLKKEKLTMMVNQLIQKNQLQMQHQIELLDAYGPLKILKRGYSISKTNNKIIKSCDDIKVKDKMETILQDGVVYSVVCEKENAHEGR